MIAVICILVPSLLSILIHGGLTRRQHKSKIYRVNWYMVYTVVLNGVIWVVLRLFFTNGDQLFYNLMHNRTFAGKYFALALALAVLFPLIARGVKKIHMGTGARRKTVWARFKEKIHRRSVAIRAVTFVLIGGGLFCVVNMIAQPLWKVENQYDTVYGFYEEPENSIETIFLGPSHTCCGFSPMELYEKYGICSYNIASSRQPMAASYYWLEETYRLHSETLDTVVLDVAMLKNELKTSSFHIAIDNMRFSGVKLRAVKSYSEDFTDFICNMFPAFSYHERWKELTDEDFQKLGYDPEFSIRGYHFLTSQWLGNATDFSELSIPLLTLDETAENTQWDETAELYFRKIASFCEDKGLSLVLVKTPTAWTSSDHNAAQELADEYGLDYIDFNVDPYYSEIGFNLATDMIQPTDTSNLHANYYGMLKMTDYLGEYLINECGNHDVRGEEKYAYLDEELEDYHRYIASADLTKFTDPCDYIAYALEAGEYTIFLSVKDDAADALTEEQRTYFASIGLEQLSQLSHRSSYLAVLEDGEVKKELCREDSGDQSDSVGPLSYSASLPDGTEYTVTSGGHDQGNISSVEIGETERSVNNRGLNIVVYDNKRGKYVAHASFNTSSTPERKIQNPEERLASELDAGATLSDLTGTDRTLYLYNRRCENDKNVKLARQTSEEGGLFTYLDAFLDDENLEIYLSVRGDAAGALDDTARTALAERGFTKLSGITEQDSYIALLSSGEVLFEECNDENSVARKTDKYSLSSAGVNAGNASSIKIDGTEYSNNKKGINIVIYDTITGMVIDSISFDTGTITPILTAEDAA